MPHIWVTLITYLILAFLRFKARLVDDHAEYDTMVPSRFVWSSRRRDRWARSGMSSP
jgi:hypothetical protein